MLWNGVTKRNEVTRITLWQRISAAYDLVRGKVVRGKSEQFPFYFASIGNRSGYPHHARTMLNAQKIRRFSETPIPRRLINYLRSQVASLNWQIEPLTGVTLQKKHLKQIRRVTKLLRRPNPDDPWRAFLGQIIEDMLTVGWGPVEIKTLRASEKRDMLDDGSDFVEEPDHVLWPIDGATIQAYMDWDGSPGKARWAQVGPDGKIINFLNHELITFKHTPRTSNPFGLAPMEVALAEIEHLLNAISYAGRVASNAVPKKALWIKNLTAQQQTEMLGWWQATVEGSASIPFIGGEQVEAIELGLVTDANLFLQWQEFLIAIIADAFGIDVQKVNLIVGINRSTGETLNDVTDEGSIMPLAEDIAAYVNQFIMPLYGLGDVAEFKFLFTSGLSDRKAISTINQIQLQDDEITIDEARSQSGKPPLVHPMTKEPIGQFTLSAYRKLWDVPGFVKDGMKAIEEQQKSMAEDRQFNQELEKSKVTTKQDADTDPAKGGQNGVHSAPRPKEKPVNRADEREE